MAKTKGARGFGSIDKLPSGNYRVRYTDPNGNPQRARVTFTTKREAEFELARIRQAIESGSWQPDESPQAGELDPKAMTLTQLAKHWRGIAVTSQGSPLAPSTLKEYERLITNTLARFANKPIRQITTQQLETWRAAELSRGKLNQTSKAYKHLKTLMDYAVKRRFITSSPCTIERATSYKPAEPPAPTREQVEIMLANAPETFKVILALASQGGLRKGEILELRRKDIELAELPGGEQVLSVNVSRAVTWIDKKAFVKLPKTKTSVRSVMLPPSASELVKAHLRSVELNPEALLFSRNGDSQLHWREGQLRGDWERVSALAGYRGRFHILRNYHLTQYGLNGATIKEIMDRGGHKDIHTAMRYQRNTGREAELVQRLG